MVDFTRLPGVVEGKRKRNIIVGAVYVFAVLGVVSALGGGTDDPEAQAGSISDPSEVTPTPTMADGGTPAATATAAPTATATSASTPEGIPEDEQTMLTSIADVDGEEPYYDPATQSFSGEGETVTESHDHPGGLLVLDYEHDGESNFIVEVYNEGTGESQEIPINKIGAVDGVTGVALEPGEYSFDVDADGSWSLNAANPIAPPEEIHAPPATASRDVPDVVGPIEIDGSVTVTGSHAGDQNIIVWLYNEDAGQFDGTLVFNEIGQLDGAENRVSHDGVAWIVVEANGEWELEFE